jgi:hypothetical protein
MAEKPTKMNFTRFSPDSKPFSSSLSIGVQLVHFGSRTVLGTTK